MNEFLNPERECDLVMKGGVTSGIVYPPAVIELARQKWRFVNIGGASAGAIAAAAAAAAEYGREQGGFAKLADRSGELARPGALLRLFQPRPQTRPVFDTALRLLTERRQGAGWPAAVTRSLAAANPRSFALGAAGGLAVTSLLADAVGGSLSGRALVPAALLAWAGGLAGSAFNVGRALTRDLPNQDNLFGMVTGQTHDAQAGQALTDWLHTALNDLAGLGRDELLTFGMLRNKAGGQKAINLEMMTTNTSHKKPYRLPFAERTFLFNRDEMSTLFPARVVDHLVDHAYRSARLALPPGFAFLPDANDLPVIVATRMSLSYPILVSAVPLYTLNYSALQRGRQTADDRLVVEQGDLQRNWFSDGGIVSNFPIHLFDAWLPSRPTFAIFLDAFPPDAIRDGALDPVFQSALTPEAGTDAHSLAEIPDVELGRADQQVRVNWRPINSIVDLLKAILYTTVDYRDTLQAALPSYRDRIVTVRLTDAEGGLNLAMKHETVEHMQDKGQRAGQALSQFNFDHHRWVRFRVLLAELEQQLADLRATLADEQLDYLDLIAGEPAADHPPYDRDPEWRRAAVERIERLQDFLAAWLPDDGGFFHDANTPQPEPALRPVPRY